MADRPEVPPMDELEKLRYEKELLGFFLSGHPVDTLGGLGPLLDDITAEEIENLEGKRSFRLCGVLSEIERRYTKKDAKPWARFTLMTKEKIFLYRCSTIPSNSMEFISKKDEWWWWKVSHLTGTGKPG
jgi:DNA polymerase III alpha subunit